MKVPGLGTHTNTGQAFQSPSKAQLGTKHVCHLPPAGLSRDAKEPGRKLCQLY